MPPSENSALTVIFDIDGTLVDSNYQHVISWHRAFRQHGYAVPQWAIHRHVGMGGDQLVGALIGEEGEESDGESIREFEAGAFEELIGETETLEGASELLRDLRDDGATLVLSSSAKDKEVDHYLDLLGARDLVADWTTSADVEATKPEPDLIEAALEKAGERRPTVLVGDTPWDVKAAERAGVPTLAVLTGGFSEEELREAGAADVVTSIGELLEGRGKLAALAR
jgi:HAD superfamily hydrolase (TIGR01509 family)